MNRKTTNIIVAMLVLTMITVFITACGGTDTSQNNASTTTSSAKVTPAKDVTITVAASTSWIRDIDRTLAEKFTQETGIKIDLQANPDDQYENVILTRLATGEGPDVYMGETGLALMRFQPEKYALELSDEPWVSKYADFMFEQAGVNGKLFGFTTWGRDFRAMIYNSELFAKYDIATPTSYDTFAAACEKLLANGITPVYFAGAEEWYCDQAFDGAINVESKAPGTYEALNNGAKYADSAEAIKFLENLKDSADKGYFGKDFLANTYDQGQTALSSEEYAMWFGWATYVNDIAAVGGPSADSYLAFPCPYADDFSTLSMTGAGMTRLINKDSKNIDACKEYFNFLATDENLQAFYDGRQDLLESTFKGVTTKAPKDFTFAMELVENKTLPSPRQAVLYQGADGSFGKNIQSMFFNKMTPKQVLESLDAARAKTFETVK